jgi:diguanylate cyclase (GGDEF)-like protein/PAS domain S-box-containing protein
MTPTARRLQRYLRQHWQAFLIVGSLLALLWVGVYLDLRRSREDTISRSASDLTNLSLAFLKETEASIKAIDLALLDLREHWNGDVRAFAALVHKRQDYLSGNLAFQVAVIDRYGLMAFSSLDQQNAKPVDLSDREHFKVHRERDVDELFISKPLLGRVSQRWSIQFTRPIFDQEHRFAGVLVLSVGPEYFYRFYRSIELPTGSSITLAREDGEVLSRYPNPEKALGRKLVYLPFLKPSVPDVAMVTMRSPFDGIERSYAVRKVDRFNLLVILGYPFDQIEAPYREQRLRAVSAGIGLSVSLLLVAYLRMVSAIQRQRAAKQLADNEERWRLALEAAGDGVWDWDVPKNRFVFSAGWKRLIGRAADGERSEHHDAWEKRIHPDDLAQVMQRIEAHFSRSTLAYTCEYRILCEDGCWKWILDRGMVIARDEAGMPLRMVGTCKDISSRKQMEEALQVLATTDALTGLNNRRCFLQRLEQEAAQAQDRAGVGAAVLMADIDFFKSINDRYGHAVGDAALKHFAGLLRQNARPPDVLGRLGGEEFAALLPHTTLDSAMEFASRLCASLRETPLVMGDQAIAISVSIGVSILQTTGDDSADQALHRADMALYQAKNTGRDRAIVWRDSGTEVEALAVL